MQSDLTELSQLLRERISFLPKSKSHQSVEPFEGAERYVLSSLMQKAIRRGDSEIACRAGAQLLKIDPSQVWRRLRIAALEDIGMGSPETMALVVGIASLRDIRRTLGGNDCALHQALIAACRAPKDRTADHMASIARSPMCSAVRQKFATGTDSKLFTPVILDKYAPVVERVAAATAFHRRIEPLTSTLRRQSVAPLLETAKNAGAIAEAIMACAAYVGREREVLPLYVVLSALLFREHNSAHTTAPCPAHPPTLIDGIPEYAFDPLHTRVGRRAVGLWRRCYLVPPPWSEKQIAVALWNIESASCDKRFKWKAGEELRQCALRADLLVAGVPEEQHDDLHLWVLREASALTCARKAAWRSAKES